MAGSVNQTLEVLNKYSYNSYLKLFREAIVNKLAVEWNTTVAQSHVLKAKTDQCNTSITDSDMKCQTCATQCRHVPLLRENVNLVDPFTYMSGPLNDVTRQLGDLLDLVEERSLCFLNSIYDLATSSTVPPNADLHAAFEGIKEGVFAAKHGFSDDGRYVTNTASQTVVPADKNNTEIGDGMDKNTTSIDSITASCIGKCADCMPLFLPTHGEVLASVCGDKLVNETSEFMTKVNKLKTVYGAVVDKMHPILSQIELDQSSMNYSLGYSYTLVYVTVNIRDQYRRYRTSVLFSNMYRTATARNMTLEYWNKFD